MAVELDGAVYNPSDKPKKIQEGKYPGHISHIETKEMNTKAGPAIIVNMKFKTAEEVSEQNQSVWELDGFEYVTDDNGKKVPVLDKGGKQVLESCDHMVGKEFYSKGWFIFKDAKSSSKNSRYFELLEKLGVDCKVQKVNGKSVKKLVLLEEKDVMGKPVLFDLKKETYMTRDTNEERSVMKVSNLEPWHEGKALESFDLSDEVPF
tara:strand:- start:558 stop:1175 length:618 start_codon:yes stop_codon:yes gene_type:complete